MKSGAILVRASLVTTAIIAGCAGGSRHSGSDGGGLFTCTADTDCNDGQDCTVDSCDVGGTCRFTPIDARCPSGMMCVVGTGCTADTPCSSDADCDDSIACTLDSCGVGATCRHMALNELCTDPAAGSCDPTMGCVAGSGCHSDADCDDAIDCTLDTCGVDMTCRHMSIDARCMAGETCSPTMGCFTPHPCTTAADCQDGNFCNGAEQCVAEFGCAPADAPRACDDSNPCTHDSCDTTSDMCVFQCDPTLGTECAAMCPPPAATCAGSFALSPSPTFMCGCLFGSCAVMFDFSTVTFTNDGVSVTVTPASSSFPALSDVTDPVCPMFEATTMVSGDCNEEYTLSGMFSDDDTFTGTLRAHFTAGSGGGGIGCVDCTDRMWSVTGTRR